MVKLRHGKKRRENERGQKEGMNRDSIETPGGNTVKSLVKSSLRSAEENRLINYCI